MERETLKEKAQRIKEETAREEWGRLTPSDKLIKILGEAEGNKLIMLHSSFACLIVLLIEKRIITKEELRDKLWDSDATASTYSEFLREMTKKD